MTPVGRLSAEGEALTRIGVGSQPGTVGSGASRTPLEQLSGTLTPSRLHFERHHAGVPTLDPGSHELRVHGLVDRPLAFKVEALARYPMVTRYQFLECSGNSGVMIAPEPVQNTCGAIHGLVSESEWTGVQCAICLKRRAFDQRAAGLSPMERMQRAWHAVSRSKSCLTTRSLRSTKWRTLRREPYRCDCSFLDNATPRQSGCKSRGMNQPRCKDETSKYTDREEDGRAAISTFEMGVKSVITSPSLQLDRVGMGVSSVWLGLVRCGADQVGRVSADGGKTATAALDSEAKSKSLTRFRIPLQWSGQPLDLVSRATDERGAVQPTRAEALKGRGVGAFYHYNGMQAWHVDNAGTVSHVYV